MSQSDSSRITLLEVPIDPITSSQALDALRRFLGETQQRPASARASVGRHVMTPNAEMLVEATRNPAFKEILQRSDLNLPDSVGLLHMARWTGQRIPERVTGVDTVVRLCSSLDQSHTVFLLGAAPGVAEKAGETLKSQNPNLRIIGTHAGSPSEEGIIEKISALQPHLLLVAFGAPKQDLWIAQHLSKMPSVRVAMGVGGTFDFLAGTQKRAPVIFQSLGLEWLWRLLKEPKRFKRIWNAVVIFPLLVVMQQKKANKLTS